MVEARPVKTPHRRQPYAGYGAPTKHEFGIAAP
jgi:hypothetical protein